MAKDVNKTVHCIKEDLNTYLYSINYNFHAHDQAFLREVDLLLELTLPSIGIKEIYSSVTNYQSKLNILKDDFNKIMNKYIIPKSEDGPLDNKIEDIVKRGCFVYVSPSEELNKTQGYNDYSESFYSSEDKEKGKMLSGVVNRNNLDGTPSYNGYTYFALPRTIANRQFSFLRIPSFYDFYRDDEEELYISNFEEAETFLSELNIPDTNAFILKYLQPSNFVLSGTNHVRLMINSKLELEFILGKNPEVRINTLLTNPTNSGGEGSSKEMNHPNQTFKIKSVLDLEELKSGVLDPYMNTYVSYAFDLQDAFLPSVVEHKIDLPTLSLICELFLNKTLQFMCNAVSISSMGDMDTSRSVTDIVIDTKGQFGSNEHSFYIISNSILKGAHSLDNISATSLSTYRNLYNVSSLSHMLNREGVAMEQIELVLKCMGISKGEYSKSFDDIMNANKKGKQDYKDFYMDRIYAINKANSDFKTILNRDISPAIRKQIIDKIQQNKQELRFIDECING